MQSPLTSELEHLGSGYLINPKGLIGSFLESPGMADACHIDLVGRIGSSVLAAI